MEVSIAGWQGRYRLVGQVTSPRETWLDVVGPLGKDGPGGIRSCSPASVRTVHRKPKYPRKPAE